MNEIFSCATINMIINFFKSKKVISIFSSILILAVGTVIATVSTIVAGGKTTNNVYYKFDGNIFRSNTQLMEYVNYNMQVQSYGTQNNYYLYNNKSYGMNNFNQLEKDMMSKTPIKEYYTYRNPYEYLIDSANQLSSQVLTSDVDKLVSVFQGKDGNAYLSKQDAINTYHDYQKVYQLGNINNNETNIEFQNKYEAVQYLENIVLKNLGKELQTDRYEMAGSFFTKDQILSWLESTTDIQYNYNGYRWSKLSHSNLQKMQLTQQDEKNYIKRYSPPKDTYWLKLDARGLSGNFSGPLYIETDVIFNTLVDRLKNNWQKISSNTINALMTPLVLFSTFINVSIKFTRNRW